MIIKIKKERKEYQYSQYKKGWELEVVNDYGEYYTAIVRKGCDRNYHNTCLAVHKKDCSVI